MKREDGQFRIATRERLFIEQGGICYLCGNLILGKPSLDHIIPLEDHEPYADGNYAVCHSSCNKTKQSHIIFTNLYDRLIYPIIDIPYIFRLDYIQTNRIRK